jgi:hypothetical protein
MSETMWNPLILSLVACSLHELRPARPRIGDFDQDLTKPQRWRLHMNDDKRLSSFDQESGVSLHEMSSVFDVVRAYDAPNWS